VSSEDSITSWILADRFLGYDSNAAHGLHKALLQSTEHGWSIHSRVLGNVLYLMASLTTSVATVRDVESRVLEGLHS
jgi:dethiobiotin synthetase/adenosylmethionine--8-amino-7-oxononanoate aminotransferase